MTDPVAIRYAAMIEATLRCDYVAAIAHLRWLDTQEGEWKYRRQQQGAICRVEKVFKGTFGRQAWPHMLANLRMQYENEVGYFCHRLGVAALIDDMRDAFTSGYKPQSLLWFIRSSKDGEAKAGRWEWLITEAIERETLEAKAEEAKAAEDLHRRGILPDTKTAEPNWVAEARQALAHVRGISNPTTEERRAAEKAKALLERFGYES